MQSSAVRRWEGGVMPAVDSAVVAKMREAEVQIA